MGHDKEGDVVAGTCTERHADGLSGGFRNDGAVYAVSGIAEALRGIDFRVFRLPCSVGIGDNVFVYSRPRIFGAGLRIACGSSLHFLHPALDGGKQRTVLPRLVGIVGNPLLAGGIGKVDGCQFRSLGIGVADEFDMGAEGIEEHGAETVVAGTGVVGGSHLRRLGIASYIETFEIDPHTLSEVEVGIEAGVLDAQLQALVRGTAGSAIGTEVAEQYRLVEVAGDIVCHDRPLEDEVFLHERPEVAGIEVGGGGGVAGAEAGLDIVDGGIGLGESGGGHLVAFGVGIVKVVVASGESQRRHEAAYDGYEIFLVHNLVHSRLGFRSAGPHS